MKRVLSQAAATWMVRDLINTPPNILGTGRAREFRRITGGSPRCRPCEVFADALLEHAYPTDSGGRPWFRCGRRGW